MPIYLYQHETTGEVREIFQGMNEEHVYHGEEGNEDGWKRVYTVPQASFNTQLDPNDGNAFVKATSEKKGTYGDLHDLSEELSQKRAESHGGTDPLKEEYFKNYSKARNGAKHPEELKQKNTFADGKIKVDWDG